jgi:hypothetical protein
MLDSFAVECGFSFVKSESQKERDSGDAGVEPGVGSIVRDDAEQGLIAGDETEDSHEAVNDAKDSEKELRRVSAGQAAGDRRGARQQMNKIVRWIDVKDSKQMTIARDAWNKAENTNQQENQAECDRNSF